MLTGEEIQFYREKGYLGVDNVLSSEDVKELRRVTDEFIERSRAVAASDEVFDLEPDHSPENPRLRRIKNPSGQDPVFDRVHRHDGILDIVAQLIGPAVRSMGTKLNMKAEDSGSPVEWHQDWAFYPHTNDDLLAVGVAIDDMTRENGCLMVIPGSHQGKVYDHHQDGRFVGAVTEEDFDDGDAEPVEVSAGGISLHHVRALHGSLPNVSNKPRRLLLIMFAAADAWPLINSVRDWDAYNSGLLRGDPVWEPRLEKLPVRVPLPPPELTGSIFETQTLLKNSNLQRALSASR